MKKSNVLKSSELLKLENSEATSERHLAKLFCMKSDHTSSNASHIKLRTHRVDASSVLNCVKGFLPELQQANDDLNIAIEDRGQNEFDIENVENADGIIEMNLALVEQGNSSDDSSDDSSSNDYDDENSKKHLIETLSSSMETEKTLQRNQDRSKESSKERDTIK